MDDDTQSTDWACHYDAALAETGSTRQMMAAEIAARRVVAEAAEA